MADVRTRARDEISALVHRRATVEDFTRQAVRALGRAVPFDGSCLVTLDPATLVPTGEVVDNALDPELRPRMTEIELREPDVNTFASLTGARRAAGLSEATGGDLDASLRHRELRGPSGFGDELRVALADDAGAWGGLTLLRRADRPAFTPADIRLCASLSGLLGEGVRRAVMVDDVASGARPQAGVVVLAPDHAVLMANPAAAEWLVALSATAASDALPVVVLAVAGRARHLGATERHGASRSGDGRPAPERPATARVRLVDRRWATVHASLLGSDEHGPVAVVIDEARAPELAPLIADAYELTDRERRVTELVAQGRSTAEVARQLHLSPYTVQDHLKAIFAKTGARSRGDLVARVFFEPGAPRLESTSRSRPDDPPSPDEG